MDDDFDLAVVEESGEGQTSKKRLVVALVLLVIIALSFKVHWIAGYVLLIAGLLFLIFYLPSPKLRRLLIILYLVFVIALLTGTVLQTFLATNKTVARLVEENKLVNSLIGGLAEQVILSTVIGLITGVSVVGGSLLAVMLVSSEYILALHEVHGIRRKDALRVLWSLIMGINYPWMIIEDGKVTESKPAGILPVIGGPGVAVIRAGNAVVFERSGKISRIAGSGLVLLKRYERIKAIFELRPLGETRETENVLTKDRIPLTVVMGAGFQIEPKEVTDQRPESFVEPNGEALSEVIGTLYKTYKATLEKAVYHAPPSGWGVMIPGAAQSLLRDVIATYNFDEIFKRVDEVEGEPGGFDPDQRTIKAIENKIMERLSAAALQRGAQVRGIDIREIRIREDVLEKMLDWWGAEWKRKIAIKEAEGERTIVLTLAEAERKKLIEGARARAIETKEIAQTDRDVTILKAKADRDVAILKAEAEVIEARGEKEATIEKGLGDATARAEQFAKIVEALRRAGLLDDEVIADILREICRAVGYEQFFRSMEIMSMTPLRRLPSRARRPMRAESEVEGEEESQAE